MASEKRPEILYDFLLIDRERLHVLHSQLFPEARPPEGAETRTAVAALMEVLRKLAYSGMICPDPTVAALMEVLRKLAYSGMICPDPTVAVTGNLLLLQGRLGILDFELCDGLFSLLPDVVQASRDPYPGDLFRRRPPQRSSAEQKPSDFFAKVAALAPESVTVLMKHADVSVWGAARRKTLFSATGQLAMQSGPVLPGDWSMLAIVDVPLTGTEGEIDGLSDFVEGLLRGLEGMRSVIGMPKQCLGVTPLAVFRRLLPSTPFKS